MKPVLQIHFRHSSINVQVQQIHLRIEFLQPLFNALCHNMIGNATERLNTNDPFYPLPCITSPAISQPSPNWLDRSSISDAYFAFTNIDFDDTWKR